MYKVLITFLFISQPFYAQQANNYARIDSLSYTYFINGNWDKLIEISKDAERINLDFKYLQQRVGFAYFSKGDYFSAQYHYEKALKFDAYDVNTLTYLYYCGQYTVNETNARYYAKKLPLELKKSLKIKSFSLVNLLDFEYNFKSNSSNLRSNTNYIRIGIHSYLNSRLNIYQSLSTYSQTIDSYSVKQDEYFALLDWTLSPHIVVSAGYHYINAKIDSSINTTNYKGNMGLIKLTTTFNRFDFGLSAMLLNNYSGYTSQISLQAGAHLPGNANMYLQSSIYS